jgi:hypothetical protein
MASDGLLAAINSKQLRMNAWSKMNDPREANGVATDWDRCGR